MAQIKYRSDETVTTVIINMMPMMIWYMRLMLLQVLYVMGVKQYTTFPINHLSVSHCCQHSDTAGFIQFMMSVFGVCLSLSRFPRYNVGE